MKIAFFADTYEPQVNGVVTSIKSFANEMRKRGHEVHIFCPHSSSIKDTKFMHTTPSIKFYPYPEYRVGLPNKKFYDIIKEIQPDIIHVHSPAPIGLMGTILAKRFGIPLIATYHTMLTEFLQYLPGNSFLVSGLSKKTVDTYTKWFYNLADFITTPGTTAKNYLKKIGVRRPIEILQTGVEQKKSFAKKKASPPIILHVGRLSEEKRVDLILRAFAEIKEKTNAEVVITSDGPARNSLEKLASSLGISGRVKFTGYISEKEKENLYESATTFVMASTADTQGLTVLESMSFGLPVITAKAGGFIDFVKNNSNGIFFKPNSEKDLAEKIYRVLSSRALQKKLSSGGLATAKELSIENCATRLETFYNTALPSRKISVIIPTYMEEKYLGKTLLAVKNQKYKNFEIIVVDSDSTDKTRSIAKKFSVNVINIKKRGVGLARNIGAKAASGDILFFLDADTILEENSLKELSQAFRDNEIIGICGNILSRGKITDKIIYSACSNIAKISCFAGYPLVYGMCMAWRKKDFLHHGGFNEKIITAEDYDLSLSMRKHGKIIFVDNLRATTSPRRIKTMGVLGASTFHLKNFFNYILFKKSYKNYATAR